MNAVIADPILRSWYCLPKKLRTVRFAAAMKLPRRFPHSPPAEGGISEDRMPHAVPFREVSIMAVGDCRILQSRLIDGFFIVPQFRRRF